MGDRHITEDPDLVESMDTDSKGRVTLGKEFADTKVRVVVQDIGDKQETNA